jgi:hypothetical protein
MAASFDDDNDGRNDAGGANDAASGAETATTSAWNFMTNNKKCQLEREGGNDALLKRRYYDIGFR